jgi:hypothetical protein
MFNTGKIVSCINYQYYNYLAFSKSPLGDLGVARNG